MRSKNGGQKMGVKKPRPKSHNTISKKDDPKNGFKKWIQKMGVKKPRLKSHNMISKYYFKK